jgi:dTDP-4-amino-4,6-dideoxygalactose transaminase
VDSWKLPLARTELGPEEIEAVQRVLSSGWLTMGPVTEAFEQAFAQYLGVRHAIAVANGTAALHLAHLAANVGPGDEVICPSLTFVATANAAAYTGARPVFADIADSRDINISSADTALRLTQRTRAITLMHHGGYPCDLVSFKKLASDNGLVLIEDASHAVGSQSDRFACGTAGDLGCFSFFSNKNMTCGEGGMVVTNDDEKATILRQLRSHGMTSVTWDRHRGVSHEYDIVRLGFNYRLDEMRAAIGLVQLGKLPEMNRARRVLADRYHRGLAEIEELDVPFRNATSSSSCHLQCIILKPQISRTEFRRLLMERGIQTSIHYPAIHKTQYYRSMYPAISLPETERVSARIVTLPLYPSLEPEAVDGIIAEVKNAVAVAGRSPQLSREGRYEKLG